MADGDTLRLDKWLWYTRLCKTRTQATALCRSGQVRVNKTPVHKPNHAVRPDDVLTFPLNHRIRVVRVIALGERRGPAPEAQALYEDLSPPPVPRDARATFAHLVRAGASGAAAAFLVELLRPLL